MTPALVQALAAALAGLGVLATASVLILRANERQASLKKRLGGVRSAHGPKIAVARGEASRSASVLRSAETTASGIAKLVGYVPARAEFYPAPSIVVWLVAAALAVVATFLLHKVVGALSFLALPALWVVICRAAYGRFNRRIAAALYAQFPDAIAMIVRTVRVGMPVSEAIALVAKEAPSPTSALFLTTANSLAIGVTLNDAVRGMAERAALPEYRFFATALTLQSQTGGGLSETLDNLADTIRKRAAARAKGHALSAEARTSTYVLAAMPVATGALLAVMNPGYVGLLFTDPFGQKLLAAALLLLSLGMFAMKTLIRRALS